MAFARKQGQIEGVLEWSGLSRLHDAAVDAGDGLRVSLAGSIDEQKRPMLDLRVSGQLHLQCQRCMETVLWPLDLQACLRLVGPGQAWPDEDAEDDEVDVIEAGPEMDLAAMVEDEVLLALPMVPMHEHCEIPAVRSGAKEKARAEGAVATRSAQAFAALAVLKSKSKKE